MLAPPMVPSSSTPCVPFDPCFKRLSPTGMWTELPPEMLIDVLLPPWLPPTDENSEFYCNCSFICIFVFVPISVPDAIDWVSWSAGPIMME